MSEQFRNTWNAMLDMIETLKKRIHPDECSLGRFAATAYCINWFYLPPILYSIVASKNPGTSEIALAGVTLVGTAIWAIICLPVSIGGYSMVLLLADVLSTLRCPSKNDAAGKVDKLDACQCQRQATPVRQSVNEAPYEPQVLATLLEQVASLQKWSLRPEADRIRLQELIAATVKTELALRETMDKQAKGSVDWKEIGKHIRALKEHSLPSQTEEALDKLLRERQAALEQTTHESRNLAEQLKHTREHLEQHVNKTTVIDPDAVIASAEDALKDAAHQVTLAPTKNHK